MPRIGRHLPVLLSAGALLAGALATDTTSASEPAGFRVVAKGLDQPKKISVAANGDLVVALSGSGAAPKSCTDGTSEASCLGDTGAIDAVTPAGKVSRLLSDLPSVSSGGEDAQATGPSEAVEAGGRLHVLFQDLDMDQKTGADDFGTGGSMLGELVSYRSGSHTVDADLAAYEAKHDPEHGAGSSVTYGGEVAVSSDPYAVVAYRGGYAVADAGADDVLFISRSGRVNVLAVLPTIREYAKAYEFGAKQKKALYGYAQPVPDALTVGPGGVLYVGELGGSPFAVGRSSVYRIVPGHRATVYASGLTGISDIAFRDGKLLVVEIDRKGLNDPGFATNTPASGEVLAVGSDGSKQVIASAGLTFATGLAVGHNGAIYVSIFGVSAASAGGHGGEIVCLSGT